MIIWKVVSTIRILIAVIMLLGNLIICTTLLFLIRSLLPFRKAREWLVSKLKKYSFGVVNSMLYMWFPKNFQILYDKNVKNLRGKSFVTVSNHVSDFDWAFISTTSMRLDLFSYMFLMMKDSLRRIPMIGYLLESFNSIFVSRGNDKNDPDGKSKINENQKRIERCVGRYKSTGFPSNPLIFVEGTYNCKPSYKTTFENFLAQLKSMNMTLENRDLLKSNMNPNSVLGISRDDIKFVPIESSKKTEEKNVHRREHTSNSSGGLYYPYYTLLPKRNGFIWLLLSLPDDCDTICDYTLFTTPYNRFVCDSYTYKDVLWTGSKSFYLNVLVEAVKIPKSLMMTVANYKNVQENNPDSNEHKYDLDREATKFLYELFEKKERRIHNYFEKSIELGKNRVDAEEFKNIVCPDSDSVTESMRLSSAFKSVFYFVVGLLVIVTLLSVIFGYALSPAFIFDFVSTLGEFNFFAGLFKKFNGLWMKNAGNLTLTHS